jgi:hypothetical protein
LGSFCRVTRAVSSWHGACDRVDGVQPVRLPPRNLEPALDQWNIHFGM